MYNITLVCTHHSEFGKCNSDELYKILNSIRPDVIFEELTPDLYDRFYKETDITYQTPEIKSVKRYIKDYTIKHFPVDVTVSHTLFNNYIKLLNTVKKHPAYLKLEEDQKVLAFHEGYDFLNSNKCEELTEKKKFLEKSLIEFEINKHRLSRIHELFYEEQHKREHEIIKNIYKNSEKMFYNQAVILLGSGHRKTFFEKIKQYKTVNSINLNWSLFGN